MPRCYRNETNSKAWIEIHLLFYLKCEVHETLFTKPRTVQQRYVWIIYINFYRSRTKTCRKYGDFTYALQLSTTVDTAAFTKHVTAQCTSQVSSLTKIGQ